MSAHQRFGRMDRRTFVKQCAALAVTLGTGTSLFQACSSAPTTAPTTSAPTVAAQQTPSASARAPEATPAPTQVGAGAEIKRGGNLTDISSVQNTTMDRHLYSAVTDADGPLLYDTFLHYSLADREQGKYEIRPALAESYEIVDPATVEFKLRRGVKFHDGSDFNAPVAAWNIERAASHPKSTLKNAVALITKTEVVNEYSLRLHLSRPSSVFLLQMSDGANPSLGMVSKEAVERLGDEKFGVNPVGTGPMRFKEWRRDDRVVLERFDGHWERGEDGRPLPYLDGCTVRFSTDMAAQIMELKAGTVHSVRSRDVADVPAVKADPNLAIQPMPGLWSSFPGMYINPRPDTPYPFSNDKRLREAAHYAIDHQSMALALGQGLGKPSYYPFFFPGTLGYDETLPRREYDLAKAKQLLVEAGYPNGIDLEVKVINRPADTAPLEVLQSMYAAAGIRLKILGLERSVWIEDGRSGRFQALSHAFQSYPEVLVAPWTKTGDVNNWSGYSNPEVDALYSEAEEQYDDVKRAEVYKRMQKIHFDDAYFVTSFMTPRLVYVNKRVRNMSNHYLYRYVWLA